MSSASNLPILDFDRICFSYAKKGSFIKDLSFSIGEGEFIGLLGANFFQLFPLSQHDY